MDNKCIFCPNEAFERGMCVLCFMRCSTTEVSKSPSIAKLVNGVYCFIAYIKPSKTIYVGWTVIPGEMMTNNGIFFDSGTLPIFMGF